MGYGASRWRLAECLVDRDILFHEASDHKTSFKVRHTYDDHELGNVICVNKCIVTISASNMIC